MKTCFTLFIALCSAFVLNAQMGDRIQKWSGQGQDVRYNTGAPLGLINQNVIYFVSPLFDEKAGNPIDKIAYSTRNAAGVWSDPVHLKSPINDAFNNTVVGVDSAGMRLYLLGRYSKNPGARVGLSTSNLVNGFWLHPETVKLKGLNPATEFYSIYVTPDEKWVFATFVRRFSRKEDLYFSNRETKSDKFSKLKRLPKNINSKQSEISPFYHSGDSVLYFAREVGEGDSVNYDLFKTRALNSDLTSWSEPEPMKDLNSPGFDAYYWRGEGGIAFFTSDQFNFGKSDILTFNENELTPQLAKNGKMDNSLSDAAGERFTSAITQKGGDTERFSMIKILDRDEMLTNLSSADEDVPTFDLKAVLKDSIGNTLPEGVLFAVKSVAGEVLKSDFTNENGAIDVRNIPIDEGLSFEVDDTSYGGIIMEVVNKKGEIAASADMDEMQEFIFEKLEAEQAAITLIKNLVDTRLSADVINKFLAGEMATLSVDKELVKDQGLLPTITNESMITLAIKDPSFNEALYLVEFIDNNGNIVRKLSTDGNTLPYHQVKDLKCSWLRINGSTLLALDNEVSYLREVDMFEINCTPIFDSRLLAEMEAKIEAMSEKDNSDLVLGDQMLGDKNGHASGLDRMEDEVVHASATIQNSNAVNENAVNGGSNDSVSIAFTNSGRNDLDVTETIPVSQDAEQDGETIANVRSQNQVGVDFNLNVYFGFDEATLDPRAQLQLQRISMNGNLKPLLLEGSADTIGSLQYNQALSQRRAANVAEALGEIGSVPVIGVGEQVVNLSAEARKVRIGLSLDMASLGESGNEAPALIIYHKTEESQPEAAYFALIEEVAAFLVHHPKVGVFIRSHTDHRGQSDYNMSLSRKRAQYVEMLMKDLGVAPHQMKATWFGETQLASGCTDTSKCDHANKAKDRRTELSFYQID